MKNSLINFISFIVLISITSCTESKEKIEKKELSQHSNLKSIKQLDLNNLTVIDNFGSEDSTEDLNLDVVVCDSTDFLEAEACLYSFFPNNEQKNQLVNRLKLQSGEIVFKPDSRKGFVYNGFLKESQCYVLTESSKSEGLIFSNLILINKSDTFCYRITSLYLDVAVTGPAESPDGSFIAYFENGGFPGDEIPCNLTILKVNKKEKGKRFLKYHTDFESEDFDIEEMRWLDKHNLILRTTNDKKGFVYYRILVE